MIHVEHLTKTYGPTCALDDVSFDVARGEVVGLLGPNGAGKTTLMRILTGYMPPTGGQASIAGYDVFEHSLEARRRIGYLPESAPLYGEMTVRAYLHYRVSLYRLPSRRALNRRDAVERAMSACRIADRADSLIDHLSKGLRQRVGLAQAIVHDSEVLILDEPTIGLDPRQIQDVRQLIRDLCHGNGRRERTILLSSHILPEVSQVCDRVLILHRGRLAAEGAPDELIARLQGARQIRVQVRAPEDAPVAALLRSLPGIADVRAQADAASGDTSSGDGVYVVDYTPDMDVRPQLTQAILRAGWELLELRAQEMSLEEVFLQLTLDEGQENPVSTASKEAPNA
jgi:ABC-2 type transport system ATP-binding protein